MAFLVGIGLAVIGWRASGAKCLGLLAVAVLLRRRTLLGLVLVAGLGLCLGGYRGNFYQHKLGAYRALGKQRVTLTVQALDDAVYGPNAQLSFDAAHMQLDTGERLVGKIEVSGFGLPAIFAGDVVQVSGKLYPGWGAYQAQISYAELELVAHHSSLIASVRRKFDAGLQSALPEPLASFGLGLLIGQRATLPPSVKQDLLMVGLTHIIAVSGYNLTIILQASKGLLAERSKRLSLLLSLSLIGSFVLLAGSSASIVRAAIVSMLSIVAMYYGRTFKPLNLIVLAAALTAWLNPMYVWSDASWYLSFLAFYGVLVVAPSFRARWRPRWRESMVVSIALESACAELMTLPFVLFTFGQISFIGLPANVLVTSLVPLAMLLCAIAGLAGMLVGPIAGWLAWPARILLTYMLDISHLLARIPHIFRQHLSLAVSGLVGLYTLALGMSLLLQLKTKGATTVIPSAVEESMRSSKISPLRSK
ncbi:MAG TPA: ComEC/Rec2 family competence protein [Candidatus Saccharimonadales bacterium]|nr:ComEC/Rec2 family competence protein [Candidatus Saccharimonadales bacterium]